MEKLDNTGTVDKEFRDFIKHRRERILEGVWVSPIFLIDEKSDLNRDTVIKSIKSTAEKWGK